MRHLKKDISTTNRPHYLSNSLTSRNVYILPIEIQLKGRKKGGREEGKGWNGAAGEGERECGTSFSKATRASFVSIFPTNVAVSIF